MISTAIFSLAQISRIAATRPLSSASPPVIITTPSLVPAVFSNFARRSAIEMWMPLRMFAAEMPRETMLMTSVSASTAQMPLTFSGVAPCCESVPISSCAMPR